MSTTTKATKQAARAFVDDELFLSTFLKIQDKQKRLVPLKLNAAQAHFLRNRTGRDIILKARQLGFSTLIQGLWYKAAVTSSCTTLTMAHLDTTTQALRRMADRFHANMPANLQPRRELANATLATYPDFGSEALILTAGSPNAARGTTTSHIHASEVAFWRDAEAIMAGAMQSLTPSGVVILESTANGAQGWFYDRCMEAMNGRGIWKLHFYEWWWSPDYCLPVSAPLDLTDDERRLQKQHGLSDGQIAWRRHKIDEIGATLFQQEYPESAMQAFIVSGGNVFGQLSHALTDEPATYDATKTYIGGVDWGQADDYTVLSIMCVEDNREVYLGRWRQMSWLAMRAQIVDACRAWGVCKLVVERNSASSNVESLAAELESAGLQITIEPRTMTAPLKAKLVTALYNGLHRDHLRLLDDPHATREMLAYTTRQTATGLWAYTHPDGGHDDTVDARMWAYYGITRMV